MPVPPYPYNRGRQAFMGGRGGTHSKISGNFFNSSQSAQRLSYIDLPCEVWTEPRCCVGARTMSRSKGKGAEDEARYLYPKAYWPSFPLATHGRCTAGQLGSQCSS